MIVQTQSTCLPGGKNNRKLLELSGHTMQSHSFSHQFQTSWTGHQTLHCQSSTLFFLTDFIASQECLHSPRHELASKRYMRELWQKVLTFQLFPHLRLPELQALRGVNKSLQAVLEGSPIQAWQQIMRCGVLSWFVKAGRFSQIAMCTQPPYGAGRVCQKSTHYVSAAPWRTLSLRPLT